MTIRTQFTCFFKHKTYALSSSLSKQSVFYSAYLLHGGEGGRRPDEARGKMPKADGWGFSLCLYVFTINLPCITSTKLFLTPPKSNRASLKSLLRRDLGRFTPPKSNCTSSKSLLLFHPVYGRRDLGRLTSTKLNWSSIKLKHASSKLNCTSTWTALTSTLTKRTPLKLKRSFIKVPPSEGFREVQISTKIINCIYCIRPISNI